jgi:hypothetical protein
MMLSLHTFRLNLIETPMDTLYSQLIKLGLQEYFRVLVSNGFDTWGKVTSITELDLDHLGFKLGHRRQLQRKIADLHGYPRHLPLPFSVRYFQYPQYNEIMTKYNSLKRSVLTRYSMRAY